MIGCVLPAAADSALFCFHRVFQIFFFFTPFSSNSLNCYPGPKPGLVVPAPCSSCFLRTPLFPTAPVLVLFSLLSVHLGYGSPSFGSVFSISLAPVRSRDNGSGSCALAAVVASSAASAPLSVRLCVELQRPLLSGEPPFRERRVARAAAADAALPPGYLRSQETCTRTRSLSHSHIHPLLLLFYCH